MNVVASDLPVLAARASATPEICGGAAMYFDPASPQDLARLLHTLEADAEVRAKLRSAGRLRVAEFSWQKTAREYAEAVQSATS